MKACARFDEILTLAVFLNGLAILDVKFANLVPPPSIFYIYKGELTIIASAKFNEFLMVGYLFKWIFRF